ncbi:MAG: glycosyltransferase family 2 protein [Acidobacteria bacterium]|nr:glycosyltransferase family 2 protein [Acidobacteriota bacterium]
MPLVSVIVPAYNEGPNLPLFYQELQDAISGVDDWSFEFVFVDDGSTDETPLFLGQLWEADERVRVVRLSRNFGSHAACLAGLIEAQGDAICFLAADLQDPPSLIPRMLAQIRGGFDVVLAVRNHRCDPWLTVKFANIYHFLMRRYAIPQWPSQGADVFMITRAIRDQLVEWKQKNTSIFAQIIWMGLRQARIPYVKQERSAGTSKWTFRKKWKLLADSFVSFSYAPIHLIWLAGVVFCIAGFTYGAFEAFNAISRGATSKSWAPLMVMLLIISGLLFFALGIIGEYLWRASEEIRGGPPFIVESRMRAVAPRRGNSEPRAERFGSQMLREVRILSFPEGSHR